MEEYDRVYPDTLEVGDIVRYQGEDLHVLSTEDKGEVIYLKAENLDTGEVMEDIPLYPDLLVALVTL